jgi:2-methylcitrate dehydratase PrpD
MDLIETIVDSIFQTGYQNLDQRTIDSVKKITIDTMGSALAGSSGEGIESLVKLINNWGGKEEATILVYGGKVPAFQAALANCAMARAWDFDDVHEAGGGHLGASIIPTAFILAEYAPEKITGKDLILAIALGTDLPCRLRQALKTQFGWVIETFAPFGVVAEATKLLRLNIEQTLSAMGLAYIQSSCNSQGVVDGALSVRLQQGIGAKAGILATHFAQIGFTGPKNVLQGVYGLYPLYGRNEYDPDVIVNELGKRFEIINTSIKPYPSCKHTHIPITATLELTHENNISVDDIESITIYTNQTAYNKCASNPAKYRPTNVVDAQFSLPFAVALAAVKGNISLSDYSDNSFKDEEIIRIMDKVVIKVDERLNKLPGMIVPNIISIKTINRGEFSKQLDSVKGSPNNPMSLEECIEKFNGCVKSTAKPICEVNISEFLKMALHLEEVDDVKQMVDKLKS